MKSSITTGGNKFALNFSGTTNNRLIFTPTITLSSFTLCQRVMVRNYLAKSGNVGNWMVLNNAQARFNFTKTATPKWVVNWRRADGTYAITNLISGNLIPNTWYNLIVSWNGTTLKSYINGVYFRTFTFTMYSPFILSNIGYESAYQPFDGMIDSIKVYNRVLSENEILLLHKNIKISKYGLLSDLNFNKGEGTTDYDISGNNNNGVLTNANYVNN